MCRMLRLTRIYKFYRKIMQTCRVIFIKLFQYFIGDFLSFMILSLIRFFPGTLQLLLYMSHRFRGLRNRTVAVYSLPRGLV